MSLPAPQASGATFAPQARFAFEGVGYVRRDVGAPVGVLPAHDGAAKAHAMRAQLANAKAQGRGVQLVAFAILGAFVGLSAFGLLVAAGF